MAVLAHVEVDLRDRVDPDVGAGVEQERDVDAVAGAERQPFEQLAARGDLARERLADAAQLGIEGGEQRARRQLGDAPAAGRLDLLGAVLERAPVDAP